MQEGAPDTQILSQTCILFSLYCRSVVTVAVAIQIPKKKHVSCTTATTGQHYSVKLTSVATCGKMRCVKWLLLYHSFLSGNSFILLETKLLTMVRLNLWDSSAPFERGDYILQPATEKLNSLSSGFMQLQCLCVWCDHVALRGIAVRL